jgi:hypothetical protein
VSVTIVRESLLALYQRDGKLTPEQVVSEAADPSHPLHNHFEWDDTAAAHRFRLSQAGHLIRTCKVRVRVEPERTERVRVFTHVQPRESYVPTDEALRSADRDVVLEQAVRELEALRRKYQVLVEWDLVLNEASKRRRGKAA